MKRAKRLCFTDEPGPLAYHAKVVPSDRGSAVKSGQLPHRLGNAA